VKESYSYSFFSSKSRAPRFLFLILFLHDASASNKVNGTIQKAFFKETHLQMTFSFHMSRDSVIESPNYELTIDRNDTVAGIRAARIKHLKYLPVRVNKVFPNLLRYDASTSALVTVSRDNFQQLKKLRVLMLRRNAISAVGHDTFSDLIALQELLLNDNNIRQLDARTFENLPNLRELNLAGNQLAELSEHLFANLIDLCEIELSGNALRTLDERVFMNNLKLVKVLANHNKINKLSASIFADKTRLIAVGLVENECVDDFYSQSDLQRMLVEIAESCVNFDGRHNRSIETRSVRKPPSFRHFSF
jgi:Leucine-rich repeat (LRR) protein